MSADQVAYVLVCTECDLHGHIVCSDATESPEFATKFGGLSELLELLSKQKVSIEEALEIRHQIATCHFYASNEELDEFLRSKANTKQDVKEMIEQLHIKSRRMNEEAEDAFPKASVPHGRLLN